MGKPLEKFSTFIFENAKVEDVINFFLDFSVEEEHIYVYKQLKIDDVRNIREEAGIQKDYKIAFVICDLSFEAQNALLKLTEEPFSDVYFAFVKPKNLFDTIRSRAQVIRFKRRVDIDEGFKNALERANTADIFKFLFSLKNKPDILMTLNYLIHYYAERGDVKRAKTMADFYKSYREFNLNETLLLMNVFSEIEG